MCMTHVSPAWKKRERRHRGWKRSTTQREWPDREEPGGHTPEKQQGRGKSRLKSLSFPLGLFS